MDRVRRYLISGGLGVLAVVIALLVTPASSTETAVGRVDVSIRPGVGRTYLDLPPLGSVAANTHASPVEVHVELGRLEFRAIGERMEVDSTTDILASTRKTLVWGFIKHGATLLVFAAVLAALLSRSTRRRSLRRTIESGITASALLAVLCVAAIIDFDAEAFRSPTFNGPLREAPDVLRRFDTALERTVDFTNRLDVITSQLAVLAEPMPATVGTTILHVSDLHSNPLGVAWVNEIVERFEVDAVIDTGDVTSFGYKDESIAIEQPLQVPREQYFIVFGNHDATDVRERLSERLTSLHGRLADVAGISVFGVDDPTYTVIEGTGSQHDAAYGRAGDVLERRCHELQPLVVAVHNPVLAPRVAGCAKIVLAGHLHETRQEVIDGGTLLSVIGSTGAGGIEGIAPDAVYQAQLLRFAAGELVAIDVLSMNPTTGEFTAQRIDPAGIGK